MGEPPRIPFRRRSRVVALLKVLLPLGALGLMSTVFLLAREEASPAALPYAELEALAREPRIERPTLSGVAADGTAVALSAERVAAVPERPDRFALSAPRLETEGPGGDRAMIEAPAGEVEPAAQRLRLRGGVRLEASGGYRVEADAAAADLLAGTLEAAPVTGAGPLGEIEAGGLSMVRGEGGAARLVFNRGVRVLYQPGRQTEVPR
jgi:lipopolysaccharide export system protein LptC